MSTPRDYAAFLSLLSVLVPIDAKALRSDRSVGGYLALRVAADLYLHDGKVAFDLDFYRDQHAEGGVSTRLMPEPAPDIARAWVVGAFIKATTERFMSEGCLDVERVRLAMVHDELLRVKHGARISLNRASLNALALLRGQIPTRRPTLSGPAQDLTLPAIELVR